MIPIKDCIKHRIYRVDARNFDIGVYDGNAGFVGIRYKFGDKFLDTEFHYDTSAPYGTVKPLEDTGINLPENIDVENLNKSSDENYNALFDFINNLKI